MIKFYNLSLFLVLIIFLGSKPLNPDRQFWFEKLKWPKKYESSFYKTYGSGSGVQVFKLNENHSLIQIQTYLGAYQPAHIYMIYEVKTQKSHIIQLPFFFDNQYKNETEIAGLESFNNDKKILSIYSKSRGVGGCGLMGMWAFKKEKPVLILMRYQTCAEADSSGENMILDPNNWPIVWPHNEIKK